MTDRVFVDTNILIYSLDPQQPDRRLTAVRLIGQLSKSSRMVTSAQTLNECYRVLTDRRQIMPRSDARRFVEALVPTCTAPSNASATQRAFDIQAGSGFAWWDCLMMASAVLAGCSTFLTEHAQAGQSVDGMRLLNPFTHDPATLFD